MKILTNKQYQSLIDIITQSQSTADKMVENFNRLSEHSQNITKSRDYLNELILAMNDYITLLGKELDDCTVMLSIHGWQSKRVQEGIDARNRIIEIKNKLKSTK